MATVGSFDRNPLRRGRGSDVSLRSAEARLQIRDREGAGRSNLCFNFIVQSEQGLGQRRFIVAATMLKNRRIDGCDDFGNYPDS